MLYKNEVMEGNVITHVYSQGRGWVCLWGVCLQWVCLWGFCLPGSVSGGSASGVCPGGSAYRKSVSDGSVSGGSTSWGLSLGVCLHGGSAYRGSASGWRGSGYCGESASVGPPHSLTNLHDSFLEALLLAGDQPVGVSSTLYLHTLYSPPSNPPLSHLHPPTLTNLHDTLLEALLLAGDQPVGVSLGSEPRSGHRDPRWSSSHAGVQFCSSVAPSLQNSRCRKRTRI